MILLSAALHLPSAPVVPDKGIVAGFVFSYQLTPD